MQKKFLQTLAVVCITFGGTNHVAAQTYDIPQLCGDICDKSKDLEATATHLHNYCISVNKDNQTLEGANWVKGQIDALRESNTNYHCIIKCKSLLLDGAWAVCGMNKP